MVALLISSSRFLLLATVSESYVAWSCLISSRVFARALYASSSNFERSLIAFEAASGLSPKILLS